MVVPRKKSKARITMWPCHTISGKISKVFQSTYYRQTFTPLLSQCSFNKLGEQTRCLSEINIYKKIFFCVYVYIYEILFSYKKKLGISQEINTIKISKISQTQNKNIRHLPFVVTAGFLLVHKIIHRCYLTIHIYHIYMHTYA